MDHPSVSVVIPCYNRPGYLAEALDSIASQTVRPEEVIVVDDGSDAPLAPALASHVLRPVVLRQAHQGPAAARNLGVERAHGDIIAFLDSDDLWTPRKLERFLEAMRRRPAINIFYGPMTPVDAEGRPVAGRTKPCHDGWITEALFCSSFVHVPTAVCRRQILLKHGGFDPTLPVCEDYHLWLRLSVVEPFGLVEEPLALRRLHCDRLSKHDMRRNLEIKAHVLKQFHESGVARLRLKDSAARERLAHVFFSAAREAFRAGAFQQAHQLFRQSRVYDRSPLRSWAMMTSARLLARLKTSQVESRRPAALVPHSEPRP